MKVCNKICGECPWRRASVPGYLGSASGDPWAFAGHHVYGDVPLPCHLHINWDLDDSQERALKAPLCRGFATFMRNTMSLPKDPDMAQAVQLVDPDHEAIFSNYREFHEHHANPELARSFRK